MPTLTLGADILSSRACAAQTINVKTFFTFFIYFCHVFVTFLTFNYIFERVLHDYIYDTDYAGIGIYC